MMMSATEFYAEAETLDRLKHVDAPTEAQVNHVAETIRQEKYMRYFFHDLDNPAWLQPLYDRGVFTNPPGVTQTPTGAECPFWSPSAYLINIAPASPDTVIDIALDLDTDNASVYLNFIRAATAMPADKAARLVPAVIGWLFSSDLWIDMLADASQELMVQLAQHNEFQSALQLLEALTEPEIRERSIPLGEGEYRVKRDARPRYRSWYVKQLIERRLPALSTLDPLAVTEVLETQLRNSIELERRQLPGGDGSYLWRRAVEDHPQNWGQEDLKNILTVGVRDSLEFALRDRAEAARPIIERYLADDLSIFRRLALHLLLLGGNQYERLTASVLQDSGFRDDDTLYHEYYRLLEARFSSLAQEAKDEYLDWVEQGPDVEGFSNSAEEMTGDSPSEEDIERHIRGWQLEQLMPVRRALPPDWSERYEALVQEFGQPEHPEFRVWSSTTWVGPTSPRKKDELAEMGPAAAMEYLKAFEPTGDPFDHSREGLARELQSVIEADPEGYAVIAHRFLRERIHPTYVYHLVRGLHEAWKKGADPDCRRILDFFEPISLALTGDGPALADHVITIDDVDWVGVRMAISRFLSGALRVDERPLADESMPSIRDILLRFVQDPDPTREHEDRRAGSAMDWVSIRINSARGVAASALLEYALRNARMHKAEHEVTPSDEGHARRLEPSVKVAFTRMLDKSAEPSAAVHSLFGEFLPNFLYLDRDWTVDNLDNIFPRGLEKQRYWEAAWEGYMLYSPRVYRELYEVLRPHYFLAVSALGADDLSRPLRSTEHALAGHIAIAYTRGYEELEESADKAPSDLGDEQPEGALLTAFLQGASDELRAVLVRALGGGLRADEAVPPDQWVRLRTYWAARARAADAATTGYEMDQELSAFASWVEGVPEGLDTLAPLLRATIDHLTTGYDAHQLLDHLLMQSKNHPRLAADMLGRLLERQAVLDTGPATDRIYLIGAEQQIWDILQNAMCADDPARETAVCVINTLGARGDYAYRALLTEGR